MSTRPARLRTILAALALATMFLSACRSQPLPSSATPAPSPQVTAPPASRATLSPEQSAWDRVVAAAKKEGAVTVYGSAFVSDIARRMSVDFERQYGIRLEILAGGGSQVLEKVKVEQKIGKPIADIMGSSGGSITQLVTEGLAVGVAKDLPELRDKSNFTIDPAYSPGGEIILFAWDVTPTMINTKLVKPEDEPRSWFDYLEPKWKGKILTPDPRATGSSAFYYGLRYYKVIDMDYLKRLAAQDMALWAGNNREGQRMVARGEYSSYLFGPTDGYAPLIAEGAPVKALAMKEGDVVSGRGIAVVKSGPHPNAARVFMNWMLTREGQTAFGEEAKMQPLRKGMPDFTIPQARLPGLKPLPRTWDFEVWSEKEMKAGVMNPIFGGK